MVVDCPNCARSLTVPVMAIPLQNGGVSRPKASQPIRMRRPVPGSDSSLNPPRQGGGGEFFKFLLVFSALAAGGFGYAMLRFDESPQQVWRRLVDATEARAEPLPTPSPAPKLAPAGATIPKPTPKATPEPSATPAAVPAAKRLDPMAWLLGHRNRAPKEVTLLQSAPLSIITDGKVIGSVMVPAGANAQLEDFTPHAVDVRVLGATGRIPIEATNLGVIASDEMKKPEPTPEPVTLQSQVRVPLQSMPLTAASEGIPARRFAHPSVPFTIEDLELLKANIKREPWKSGYEGLVNDEHSRLDYRMQGPCKDVERAPDVNLGQWRNDMNAVYNLALMWWFTGKAAYAQKAHDILVAWAKTQKTFGGGEAGLDLGDYVWNYAVGADILRGTWPGWTSADTQIVKKLFLDVYYPATGVPHNAIGPANKGTLVMATGAGIAAFCDDEEKLDHIANLIRTSASSGLPNTLPTGEIGETGRDGGHSYGQWADLAFACEVLWKQGIDVYSELEDRMLATGEYYARNDLGLNSPFVYFGTIDYHYSKPNPYLGWPPPRRGLAILHGAYAVRKGIVAPYLERLRQALPIDSGNWVYEKVADRSTAAPLPPVHYPMTARVNAGLQDIDLGDARPVGGSSCGEGVWTITGGGSDIWTDGNDSGHFTYKKVTGDCAFIAKVESIHSSAPNTKAGIMIRSGLSASAGERAWMGVRPDHKMEFYQRGWSPGGVWGGSNWDKGGREIPEKDSYWLKMERRGNLVSLYLSVDGASWAAVSAAEYDDLPNTAYIGLVVCSTANGSPCTATFSDVSVTGGEGSPSISVPAAPLNVFASPGDGQAPVRWLSAYDATSYRVKRATTSGGPYTIIATVSGNSYTDTGVSNGTTYYYVVSAVNAVGEGPNSHEDAARPRGSMWNVACDGVARAYKGTTDAGKAFDGNSGTKWYAGENAGDGAIQYDFGTGRAPVIKGYAITTANDVPERDPKGWQFQGSNDGVNWATLDTQSNQSFPFRHYEMGYSVTKPGAYRYYRLDVTADNGAHSIQIGDIALLADEALPDAKIPPLRHWGTNDNADRERAFASKEAAGN